MYFLDRVSQNTPIPNFVKVRSVGAELFHADGQTDVTKLIVKKVKVIPQQAEVGQGVPGRLRPRIFLTFDTTRVVGRQPYAPAAFTPGEIPGTHF